MGKALEILGSGQAIHVGKDNGTQVDYFLFPEYEIHLNKVRPHTVQEWHYHSRIEEVLIIQEGVLTCCWLENGKIREEELKKGQLVRVGQSVHTFENRTNEWVEFTVVRLVLDGRDKSEIIKTDKTVVRDIGGDDGAGN